jgi:hypothetical protein
MLNPLNSGRFDAPEVAFDPGPAPQLQWIKTALLVVDDSYQREIGRRGSANVRHIAENFDWSKFAPVIVAPVEGGLFAIVDGQHRTTAAMLRGIDTVPCQSVQADRAKQAAAFAAVNGNITRTQPHQLYRAKLEAGDKDMKALADVCAAADVRIARTNLTTSKMTVGQTHAISCLVRCHKEYGPETLIAALQCVTQTSDGNAGFLRASIIESLCRVLHRHQDWRDSGEKLLRIMDDFSFPDAWEDVSGGKAQVFPNTVLRVLSDKIENFLIPRFAKPTAKKS